MLNFIVNDQILTRTDNMGVVADSVNYLVANFDLFNSDFGGTITAIFTQVSSNVAYETIVEDGRCVVPYEVIKSHGFDVSLYCYDGSKRITTNVVTISVCESGFVEGETPEDPSPTVYEQLTESVDTAVSIAESVRHDADTGVFKGDKGDKGDTGADGFSPSAKVERNQSGAKITITDKVGTTVADVFDGESGVSTFVATYTEENDTWTCDKTFSKIVKAYGDGQIVVANVYGYSLPLLLYSSQDEGLIFSGGYCFREGSSGVINTVITITHTNDEIAAYIGQYMDGETLATILDKKQNLPLIVTFTEQQGGSYSADKTFTEIYSAYSNGYEIVGKFGVEVYNLSSITDSAVAFVHILANDVNIFIVTDNGVTSTTVKLQSRLSAGTGIAIRGNVISATLNWNIVVVNSLPAVGESQTFYFLPKQNSAQGDVYDEYVWVNNAFEHIGSTEVDLSNYYTKTEVDTLISTAIADVSVLIGGAS